MNFGVIVFLAWVTATCIATYAMVKRIDSHKPDADWGDLRQLVWHVLAAVIVFVATYVMLTGAAEGRMALPSKRTPTPYFYAESQPVAFWLFLAVVFVLTSAFSALLLATSFLVLRSSRRRA